METDLINLKCRTLTTEPSFRLMTSTKGHIESMALTYLDDFKVSVHESPVSQQHFTDVKALVEWREVNLALSPNVGCRSYNTDTRVVGMASVCLVHTMLNSMVLLNLSSARCRKREDPVTAKRTGLR